MPGTVELRFLLMAHQSHFTTRRGFIAAAGFGGTALYGLWVGYGAAPGPRALLDATRSAPTAIPGEHAAASASQAEALTPEDFELRVRDFVARFGTADGSVRPRPDGAGHEATANDAHGGRSPHMPAGHGGHAAVEPAPQASEDAHRHGPGEKIDVWLQAGQFFFEPGHLRLVTHQPYRFRMMATDVSHGASIQFGRGGRMTRLRPGQLVETDITLHRPGDYLVYCTVYCGAAHEAMQARLSVTEGGAA
jgi:cytochrome c oxidase subunit II